MKHRDLWILNMTDHVSRILRTLRTKTSHQRLRSVCMLAVAWIAAGAIARPAAAQPIGATFVPRPATVHSGSHSGRGEDFRIAFSDVIIAPKATLLRVHFSSSDLGGESFITLTSLIDGGVQRFNQASLMEWGSWSAIFNGGLVRLDLHVAPRDRDVHIDVDEISVGEPSGPILPIEGGIATLCGADNRTASSDSRIGRMSSANCGNGGGCGGCTGWLVSNGAVLTAGHCNGFAGNLIEFNVPQSTSGGMPVAADPDDQYPVGVNFLLYQDNGTGEDWSIMGVGSNSNTGLRPHFVQGYFHLSPLIPSSGASIRVTGYGIDNTPSGPGGAGAACCDFDDDGDCDFNCNSKSLTQQTSTGPFDQLGGTALEYEVDTMPANSGSPVIRESTGYALGIHTTGGCDDIFIGDNQGTWCGHTPFSNGMNQFISNATFVDAEPVATTQLGTVTHPARNLVLAGSLVPNGGTVFIVAGNYTAAAGNVVTLGTGNKAMILTAPLGTATIGQ